MQLVINITEELYEANSRGLEAEEVWDLRTAIANGIQLPKGHGRIADMDAAIKCIEDIKGDDAIWAISLIEWACGKRTIIEADAVESED